MGLMSQSLSRTRRNDRLELEVGPDYGYAVDDESPLGCFSILNYCEYYVGGSNFRTQISRELVAVPSMT